MARPKLMTYNHEHVGTQFYYVGTLVLAGFWLAMGSISPCCRWVFNGLAAYSVALAGWTMRSLSTQGNADSDDDWFDMNGCPAFTAGVRHPSGPTATQSTENRQIA